MGRAQIGPGPGKYLLPPLVGYKNHDASRYRNPQYSIGLTIPIMKKDIGPGPKYNTENMTMYGKVHPPAYSVVSRPTPLTAFQGPGPAAYNINNVPPMKDPRPPAYSMAYRHTLKPAYTTPAPNNYDVPTTIGPKVPDLHANGAFSIGNRVPLIEKVRSPGPAKYDETSPNKYKYQLPVYSVTERRDIPIDRNHYPSPANYYPKMAKKGGYSFGLRVDTSPYITPDDEMPCINK